MAERYSEHEPGDKGVNLTPDLDQEEEVETFDISEENELLKKQVEERKKKKAE